MSTYFKEEQVPLKKNNITISLETKQAESWKILTKEKYNQIWLCSGKRNARTIDMPRTRWAYSGKIHRGEIALFPGNRSSTFCVTGAEQGVLHANCLLPLLCCWKRVFVMTSAISWRNSISLCPASFCIPRPNIALETPWKLQVFLDFLLLHSSPL